MNIRPFVTIIMPIRNEGPYIANTLSAVLAQDYPRDRMEVLVVDGMSDDGTRESVQRISRRSRETLEPPVPIILLDNPSRIVPTAFNIGLRRARGDVIVRVDGHCEIAPDYVRQCIELLQATGADNVGGLQRAVGTSWIGRAVALATSSPFGVGGARFHHAEKAGWADTVYLGAYRRDVFDHIGGFDEELVRNQDDEFNFRLSQAGGKIWLDPSIRSVYYSRSSFRRLWRQYFQYGLYKVRVIQKRGGVASWRHLVPATFASMLGVSVIVGAVTRRKRWIVSVAGPYMAANAVASIVTGRADWSTMPLLPPTFLTLHLAYGLGFLCGIWRWREHWGEYRRR